MSNKNSSTKKSVNRARKANGSNGKSRNSSRQDPRQGSSGRMISAPLAKARSQKSGIATFRQVKDGCSITNREFLGNVSVSAGWEVINRFRLNPGSAKTFPWLCTQAYGWESYRFKSLRFRYIGRTGATTNGSIQLSPDYDAADGQPATEQQLAQNRDTVEDAPWKEVLLTCRPDSMNRLYKAHSVMTDGRFATTAQDQKTIDAGQVFIAADADGVQNWGKLWVEYEVELYTPQPTTITIDKGGAEFTIPNGFVPTVAGGLFSNAKANAIIAQDVSDPIVEAIDNSTVNSPDILKFVRDWKGVVTAAYTNTLNTAGAQPILYLNNLVQGASAFDLNLGTLSGTQPGAANTAGAYSNIRVFDVIAKAGDILGINAGGLGNVAGVPVTPSLKLLLGGANVF